MESCESVIKIKSINIISSWSYNMEKNTECTICRQSLNTQSLYALESGTESIVKTGICGHMYHMECIEPWLKTNLKCPICSVKFVYK